MNIDLNNIKQFIELIPTLIVYIIPGYIVLWINCFIRSKKAEKDSHIILKSIVLSYIIISIEKYICYSNNATVDIYSPEFITATIATSALLGYFITIITLKPWFSEVLISFGVSKTLHPNVWSRISDLKNGLWVRVYIPSDNVIYNGQLRNYDEPEENQEQFILLSNYYSVSYSENTDIENYQNDGSKWVAIKIKDVTRVEVFFKTPR